MGFVWVNDTDKYHDLPTPIMWPEKTVFTTSATHQLHCLVRALPTYNRLLSWIWFSTQFSIVQTYSGLASGHEIPDDHHWHMIHCFDYMRQAIMCSADMALEGLETTFPDHNGGSDGWDSKHGKLFSTCHLKTALRKSSNHVNVVCKDWSEVKSYLESVRAYDDQLIYWVLLEVAHEVGYMVPIGSRRLHHMYREGKTKRRQTTIWSSCLPNVSIKERANFTTRGYSILGIWCLVPSTSFDSITLKF